MKCFPRELSVVERTVPPIKTEEVAPVSKQSGADHSVPAVGSKIYIVFGSNMGSSK